MRIAPAGLLIKNEMVFDTACQIAAITHGHPSGYLAAGCLAQIINGIITGMDLIEAIQLALITLEDRPDSGECLDAVGSALKLWKDEQVSFSTVEKLGKGWIAEEALAIGLYCALAAENDFEKGVSLAVNHGGDSDSTGAIAGNILGAMLGRNSIPAKYLEDLELVDVIDEIATDVFENTKYSNISISSEHT